MKKIIEMIRSSDWPEAVDLNLVCDENAEKDKLERAESICTLVLDNLHYGKNVLDFGCGEGHVVDFMSRHGAKKVIGYDINNSFGNFEKAILTTNWDIVEKNAPYDLINVYDVMDHIENINQIEALILLKSVLSDNGRIHIRYHPFISRHGAHTYRHFNKAFAHLFLDEEELKSFIPRDKMTFTHAITFPQTSYNKFAKIAGLKTQSSYITARSLEKFFYDIYLQDYVKEKLEIKNFPSRSMSIEFIDKVYSK